MQEAIDAVVAEASWKLRTLMRASRFYTNSDLVMLYKTQLLSFIEYRTPAVYHASDSVFAGVDHIQS